MKALRGIVIVVLVVLGLGAAYAGLHVFAQVSAHYIIGVVAQLLGVDQTLSGGILLVVGWLAVAGFVVLLVRFRRMGS